MRQNQNTLLLNEFWNSLRVLFVNFLKILLNADFELYPQFIPMEDIVWWVERAMIFTVEAWDVNFPQHILQRFTLE